MAPSDRLLHLLERLITKSNQHLLNLLLHKYHEADIAEALELLPLEKKMAFFNRIVSNQSVDVFEEMDVNTQISIIQLFKIENAVELIKKMDKDDGVDLIDALLDENKEKAQEILGKLDVNEQVELKQLLNYKEGSAGTLMTTEFISIPERLTVREAIQIYQRVSPSENDAAFYLFIVNKHNQIQGVISIRKLLLSSPEKLIKDIRNNRPITVHVQTDQEDVARVFQKYRSIVLPVVDDLNIVLGVITIDDVVDVVVDEANEDILKLSGASGGDLQGNKLIEGPLTYALIHRLPWLFVTIVGGIIASFIMIHYASQLESTQLPLSFILSFVPLLIGLAGNAGNQSATIFVRALALNQMNNPYKAAFRECVLGILIGVSISFFVSAYVFWVSKSMPMAICMAISIVINMVVATCIGGTFPIVLKKQRIDPAIASAPFISTTLDIIGQVTYYAVVIFLFKWWVW